MGSGNSKSIFEYKYQKERSELRRALILSFIDNPENKDILSKISAVRSIVIKNADICVTAAKEAEREFEYSPTSADAAFNELERLYTIYETNTILKSAQCRIGPVACPLGHYAPYCEVLSSYNADFGGGRRRKDSQHVACSLCGKLVKGGHQCSYCAYNLCVPCSTVYCSNGHALKLWTHPEAQHTCAVCHAHPVTSGYRCTVCEDYDICDLCTARDGRRAVQQVILDRMAGVLEYMEAHTGESATALRTVTAHKKTLEAGAYPTTLQLFEFSLALGDLHTVAVAEVRQTRITNEVLRLRALLSVGAEYSAMARREAARGDNFTVAEVERLTVLLAVDHREKSPQVRRQHIVCCPLGHAAAHYTGRPQSVARQDSLVALNGKPAAATCQVCDRVAAPEGYYCDLCEYGLCSTCAVVFCNKGHPMVMWTEPEAVSACFRCQREPITSGFHCEVCNADLCDRCTAKDGRGSVRNAWEEEMRALLAFMKANKRLSDIASYYHWRSKNYVVSMGLLCEYVKELRTARARAEKQIVQKPLIDKIKELRLEVSANVTLCATAAREAARSQEYIFPTKRKAAQEAARLQELLDASEFLRSAEHRTKAGIACPLGHAAFRVDGDRTPASDTPPASSPVQQEAAGDSMQVAVMPPRASSPSPSSPWTIRPIPGSPLRTIALLPESPGKLTVVPPQTVTSLALSKTDIDVSLHTFDDRFQPQEEVPEEVAATECAEMVAVRQRACKVCGTTDLVDERGSVCYHSCGYCEYDLCLDCSTVYCRKSHPLRIWTLPEAVTLSCDLCKASGITSGYRCLECNIDICDLCTTQDCRNTFMFWPRREINKIMADFQVMRSDSEVVDAFMRSQEAEIAMREKDNKVQVDSMSRLCARLKVLEEVKVRIAQETMEKKARAKAKRYGKYGSDM